MLLRSMRKGFMSALFLGLLVLGGLSLVLSDSTGTLRGGIGNGTIATIDGTKIKIADFNTRATRILRDQQIDPTTAYRIGLINNILNNDIFELLIKKDAAQLGIRIEDRIIAEQVKNLIKPYQSENTNAKEALKQFLESQGMTEKQLVNILRDDLTSKILKATISTAAYVPSALANDFQAYNLISKDIEFAFFPNTSIVIKGLPSDADLKTYYEGLSQNYMIPENRNLSIATLNISKISKPTVSDADVKSAYEENKESFVTPESANLEQTIIGDETKAKEIIKITKSGKSLSDAVKRVMGDLKSFQNANHFSKDGLPSDIATPVFSGQSGDIIGPIKTPLGYHIIRLISLSAAHPTPFDKVKDKIRKEIEDEKIGNYILDVTTDIEDRLANGEAFEDLRKEYPITITSLKSVTKNTKIEKDSLWTQKEFDKILEKSFTLKDNNPSELTALGEEKLFSVRADKINPPTPQSFEKVKSDILKKWTSENQSQENLLSVQKKIDALSSGKIKFSSLNPVMINSMTRKGSDKLAKDVTERLINSETQKFVMAISKEKNGIYIARVNDVSIPKDLKINDSSLRQIQSDISNANYMGYIESLQDKYPVSVNEDLLKKIYGQSQNNSE